MNIQGWFPLGLTGLIFLLSKGLSRVFSNITFQKHQFLSTLSSLWFSSHIHVTTYCIKHSFDYTDICWQRDVLIFNMLSMFVIAFLPRSKHLLIHYRQVSFVEATIVSFILSIYRNCKMRRITIPNNGNMTPRNISSCSKKNKNMSLKLWN